MKDDCTYSCVLLLNHEQKDFISPLKNSNMLPGALSPSEHSKLRMWRNFIRNQVRVFKVLPLIHSSMCKKNKKKKASLNVYLYSYAWHFSRKSFVLLSGRISKFQGLMPTSKSSRILPKEMLSSNVSPSFKINPDSEQYSCEQVSKSSFWITPCPAGKKKEGSCAE